MPKRISEIADSLRQLGDVQVSEWDFKALLNKDIKDLEFGLEAKVDWIALSFVRSAEDVRDLKRRIRKIPGVPIVTIGQHKFVVERMPDAPK